MGRRRSSLWSGLEGFFRGFGGGIQRGQAQAIDERRYQERQEERAETVRLRRENLRMSEERHLETKRKNEEAERRDDEAIKRRARERRTDYAERENERRTEARNRERVQTRLEGAERSRTQARDVKTAKVRGGTSPGAPDQLMDLATQYKVKNPSRVIPLWRFYYGNGEGDIESEMAELASQMERTSNKQGGGGLYDPVFGGATGQQAAAASPEDEEYVADARRRFRELQEVVDFNKLVEQTPGFLEPAPGQQGPGYEERVDQASELGQQVQAAEPEGQGMQQYAGAITAASQILMDPQASLEEMMMAAVMLNQAGLLDEIPEPLAIAMAQQGMSPQQAQQQWQGYNQQMSQPGAFQPQQGAGAWGAGQQYPGGVGR